MFCQMLCQRVQGRCTFYITPMISSMIHHVLIICPFNSVPTRARTTATYFLKLFSLIVSFILLLLLRAFLEHLYQMLMFVSEIFLFQANCSEICCCFYVHAFSPNVLES